MMAGKSSTWGIPEKKTASLPKITAKETAGGIGRRPVFGYLCAEMKGVGLRVGQIWPPPNAPLPPTSFAVILGTGTTAADVFS